MDETQDASGEGLLQTVGLDRNGSEIDEKGESEKGKTEVEGSGQRRKTTSDEEVKAETKSDQDFEDDMAWSTQKKFVKRPTAAKDKKTADEKSWWDRFLERRRRPHAPGVWVVYFSLAALPIFGVGQAFIPVENTGSRRYAFVLLCVYVATALGLLMTTSFLGLRRYLRQRRLEMPATMAGTWLVTGAVLIVGLLVLTMLLPRPNAEYEISQLPLAAGSVEHDSSRLAMGKEGTRDEQAKNGSGERSRPETEKSEPNAAQEGAGHDNSRVSKSSAAGESHSKEDGNRSADKAESKSNGGQAQGDRNGNNGPKSDESKGGDRSDKSGGKSNEQASNGSPVAQSQGKPQGESSQSEGKSDESQSQSGQTQSEAPQPSTTVTPPDLSGLGDSFSAILKWVFYGAVVGIALWWSWNHRGELLMWLQALLTGWRDLWGLFGRRKPKRDIVPPAPRHPSFYDYADPFASGTAGQYSTAELIRYSFEAFEAWARDQGWPRETDQTAYEFARQVGGHAQEIAKPARTLADLYSRAAYAPGTLPPSSADELRELWETMRQRQPVGF